MTVASAEINLICHVAKVKAARSVRSMADVIRFFLAFNIPFESKALIKPNDNIISHTMKTKYLPNIFNVNVSAVFGAYMIYA